MARGFKFKGAKGRKDLFSATPPSELFRYAISRQATVRVGGQERKTYVHRCEEGSFWYQSALKMSMWSCLLGQGCRRISAVSSYIGSLAAGPQHKLGRSITRVSQPLLASRGCFPAPLRFTTRNEILLELCTATSVVFVGVDRHLDFVLRVKKDNYELKDRGRLGSGDHDKKEIDMLGRKIRWHEWGLTWEGYERHRKMVVDFFGMDENSKKLIKNGHKDDDVK